MVYGLQAHIVYLAKRLHQRRYRALHSAFLKGIGQMRKLQQAEIRQAAARAAQRVIILPCLWPKNSNAPMEASV